MLGIYGSFADADCTQLHADWDNSKIWVLKKEEPITTEEVVRRYMSGAIDFISDGSLIHLLEQKMGRTL